MRTRRETFGAALPLALPNLAVAAAGANAARAATPIVQPGLPRLLAIMSAPALSWGRERGDENSRPAPVFMRQQPELKQNSKATRDEKEHS
jgi:hypothetical protein